MLAAALFLPMPAQAVSAQKAILWDTGTDRVLYEKDANSRSLIASTTKIMTALIVCEQCNVLDRMRIPKEAVGIEGSSMYLREGEVLTVQELLYGLMLRSGNDAAVALAIYCGGTVEGFVALMNDKAHRLGLNGTHFENPNGLDSPNHYSTARDLAVLAEYAMNNPIFAQTVSTKQVRIGQRLLTNHNQLLWRVDGADGVKTGFTKKSGRCLVSAAEREGVRLVCVTLDCPDDWKTHTALHESGFAAYERVTLADADSFVLSLPVTGGTSGEVYLQTCTEVALTLPRNRSEITCTLHTPHFSYAPVKAGDPVGEAIWRMDGEIIARAPLYAMHDVQKAEKKRTPFSWLRTVFETIKGLIWKNK